MYFLDEVHAERSVYHTLNPDARKTIFERAGKNNRSGSSYKEGNEFVTEYLKMHTSESCDLNDLTAGTKKVHCFTSQDEYCTSHYVVIFKN